MFALRFIVVVLGVDGFVVVGAMYVLDVVQDCTCTLGGNPVTLYVALLQNCNGPVITWFEVNGGKVIVAVSSGKACPSTFGITLTDGGGKLTGINYTVLVVVVKLVLTKPK